MCNYQTYPPSVLGENIAFLTSNQIILHLAPLPGSPTLCMNTSDTPTKNTEYKEKISTQLI